MIKLKNILKEIRIDKISSSKVLDLILNINHTTRLADPILNKYGIKNNEPYYSFTQRLNQGKLNSIYHDLKKVLEQNFEPFELNEIQIKPYPDFIEFTEEEDSTGKGYSLNTDVLITWLLNNKYGRYAQNDIFDIYYEWQTKNIDKINPWNDWEFGSFEDIESLNKSFYEYLMRNITKIYGYG